MDNDIGARVELCPSTDRWMMGDRYGTVVGRYTNRAKQTVYKVKMDVSGKVLKVASGYIGRWI